jgi:hypothetical protein
MRAHWVDHADRNAQGIQDLAYIASLYGLAPRPDESVEEFREHLKRYIRTFLEGTVTVQGILRVTAEALGLRIADAYEDLETWWTRDTDEVITLYPRGDDAANRILGVKAVQVGGEAAQPARVIGTVDLRDGVDLRGAFRLSLGVNQSSSIAVNFAEVEGIHLEAVTLEQLQSAINAAAQEVLGIDLASKQGQFLGLTSPTLGSASHLEIHEVAQDSAQRILGLPPRIVRGQAATAAQVTGSIDLSTGIDLSQERFLRLAIDGSHLAEMDCAGPNPAQTTLNQIRDAINNAFAALGVATAIASHNGQFLRLASPTTGFNSSIAFQRPAAQDATTRLFGSVLSFYTGQDAQPARVTGQRDLSAGVDLSQRSMLQLRLGSSSAIINCAGTDPTQTRPFEIAQAINQAFGASVATQDGRSITVSSPTTGPSAELAIETPPTGDATEVILGIAPRTYTGSDATAAELLDRRPDPAQPINLLAQRVLQISVDGGSPVQVDLHKGVTDWQNATVAELANAINQAVGRTIASEVGQRLQLRSPTTGAASRLTILPLTIEQRQRFITRAIVTDEATQVIFGFMKGEAQGADATRARLVGQPDLSRGVDLRNRRYLRLTLDQRPAVEIDCAGKRPQATVLNEVIDAINTALGGTEVAIASNNKHLMLVSPTSGASSRILLETPRAEDALDRLLGIAPGTFRGQEATRVSFAGTIDLSTGIDLSTADRIKIAIDHEEFIEISCAGNDAANTTLNQIIQNINTTLRAQTNLERGVASDDGVHLILTSNTTGTASRIRFAVPTGADATARLFGITPPRSYQGVNAVPAQVIGNQDLSAASGAINLSVTHLLKLSVDNRSPVTVDFSQLSNPQSTDLDAIVEVINHTLGIDSSAPPVASHDGHHLILRSQRTGLAGRLTIETVPSGDARQALLGAVEELTTGTAPTPAVITGKIDLIASVDLSQRRLIRVAVDDNPAIDIDVAGATPATTFLDEIVTAINTVFPGLAAATEDNRLQLTSPTLGQTSHLALLPLRYLDLVEYLPIAYPPESSPVPVMPVRHGDRWFVDNQGALDAVAEVELLTSQGTAGPTLVNTTLGWRIHLRTVLSTGDQVRLRSDPSLGLQAVILSPDGDTHSIPEQDIWVGPLGSQTGVPFSEFQYLTLDAEGEETLQLNNPRSPHIVRLRRRLDRDRNKIAVTVTEADLSTLNPPSSTGSEPLVGLIQANNGTEQNGIEQLVNHEGIAIVRLRAGTGVNLAPYHNQVVLVQGQQYADTPLPLMVVERIACLFDVSITVQPESEAGDVLEERYRGVTIGQGTTQPEALVYQINTGSHASSLVRAESLSKGSGLTLPQGRSTWLYQDCYGSRFNQANFNESKFAGGGCLERGVFNVSRFAQTTLAPHLPPESMLAVFATSSPFNDPLTEIRFHWLSYQPGTLRVNLPADLPDRFGGRFNQTRFGQGETAPERYPQAVLEPLDDERFLARLIQHGDSDAASPSRLVKVIESTPGQLTVPLVPLGWEAVPIPFRKPQFLTLGAENTSAQIYLTGEGLNGFIGLEAIATGEWGNNLAISVRSSGPAMYDVAVIYKGEQFENARQVVLGTPLPALSQDLLKPNAIGILQAKAAGIKASVSRDRADVHPTQDSL